MTLTRRIAISDGDSRRRARAPARRDGGSLLDGSISAALVGLVVPQCPQCPQCFWCWC